MLNRAARYFPILREMRRTTGLGKGLRVLEIGSGSLGLGEFYPHSFVGCDVNFVEQPRPPMLAVRCSGAKLPFADRSFDAVVASDVLEHVPPEWRRGVIEETLRVSRALIVIGYPCGRNAHEADSKLREDYLRRNLQPPVWLEEHMMHAFPGCDLFARAPEGWSVQYLANESLAFHYHMMRAEMYSPVNRILRAALKVFPEVMESLLRLADGEPAYRAIFVLCRL